MAPLSVQLTFHNKRAIIKVVPFSVGEEVEMLKERIELGSRHTLVLELQKHPRGCLVLVRTEREADKFEGLTVRMEFPETTQASTWLDQHAWQLAQTAHDLVPMFLGVQQLARQVQSFAQTFSSPPAAYHTAVR